MISYVGDYVWTPCSKLAKVIKTTDDGTSLVGFDTPASVIIQYADGTVETIDDDELVTEHTTSIIAREFRKD